MMSFKLLKYKSKKLALSISFLTVISIVLISLYFSVIYFTNKSSFSIFLSLVTKVTNTSLVFIPILTIICLILPVKVFSL